jgi:hypothetical protein
MRFKKILHSRPSTNHRLKERSPLGNDERSLSVARVRQKTSRLCGLDKSVDRKTLLFIDL